MYNLLSICSALHVLHNQVTWFIYLIKTLYLINVALEQQIA